MLLHCDHGILVRLHMTVHSSSGNELTARSKTAVLEHAHCCAATDVPDRLDHVPCFGCVCVLLHDPCLLVTTMLLTPTLVPTCGPPPLHPPPHVHRAHAVPTGCANEQVRHRCASVSAESAQPHVPHIPIRPVQAQHASGRHCLGWEGGGGGGSDAYCALESMSLLATGVCLSKVGSNVHSCPYRLRNLAQTMWVSWVCGGQSIATCVTPAAA